LDPKAEIKKNLKKEQAVKYLSEAEDLKKKDNLLSLMTMKISMFLL
jgi:hypothetical protein